MLIDEEEIECNKSVFPLLSFSYHYDSKTSGKMSLILAASFDFSSLISGNKKTLIIACCTLDKHRSVDTLRALHSDQEC